MDAPGAFCCLKSWAVCTSAYLALAYKARELVGDGREQERVGTPTGRTWHGREEEEGVFQKTWKTLSEEREHHGGRGGGEGGRPMRKGRDSWSVLLQSRVCALVSAAGFISASPGTVSCGVAQQGPRDLQKPGWGWWPWRRTSLSRARSRHRDPGCPPMPGCSAL